MSKCAQIQHIQHILISMNVRDLRKLSKYTGLTITKQGGGGSAYKNKDELVNQLRNAMKLMSDTELWKALGLMRRTALKLRSSPRTIGNYTDNLNLDDIKNECTDPKKVDEGYWCARQKLRKQVEKLSPFPSAAMTAKQIYNLRDKYLNAQINLIETAFKSSVNKQSTTLNANLLKIYPTGSENIHSDKDVQMALNLYQKWNPHLLTTLTDIIVLNRTYSQDFFFKNKKTPQFDFYYDINYYMPSIFHYLYIPRGLTKKRVKLYTKHCYISNSLNDGSIFLVFKPDFTNSEAALTFLSKEVKAILKGYEPDLDQCYQEYKKTPANALIKAIKCIKYKQLYKNYNNYNNYLQEIVSINHICAEMYFSICSTIYVVWFMQQNKEKLNFNYITKSWLDTNDAWVINELGYLAIPTVIENHIFFHKTNKEKYNVRKQHALKYADRSILIRIIHKELLENSGQSPDIYCRQCPHWSCDAACCEARAELDELVAIVDEEQRPIEVQSHSSDSTHTYPDKFVLLKSLLEEVSNAECTCIYKDSSKVEKRPKKN